MYCQNCSCIYLDEDGKCTLTICILEEEQEKIERQMKAFLDNDENPNDEYDPIVDEVRHGVAWNYGDDY